MKKEKSTALVKFEVKEEGINKVFKLDLNDLKVSQVAIRDKRTISKTEYTTKKITKAKWEELDNQYLIDLINLEINVYKSYIIELEYLEQLAKDTLTEEKDYETILSRVELNLSKARGQLTILNTNIETQKSKYKIVETALKEAQAEEDKKEVEQASNDLADSFQVDEPVRNNTKYGYNFASSKDLEKFESYVKRYNKYLFMNLQGKQTISTKAFDPTTEKVEWEHMSFRDFREHTKSDIFYVINENSGNKQKMYFCEEWLETEWMRTQYRRTTFNPDPNFKCPDDVYNFWEGYVEPKKGDVSRFINHIDTLIDGTKEEKEYLIKLLAYSVQFPHIITGTTIAMFGAEGSGKSTVSLVMAAICPNHYIMKDDIEKVMNGFNGETLAVKYFLWEEALWGGSKKDQGKFKHFVTGADRSIEIKGVTKISVKNYAFHIFTSNNEWLVPVDKTDRRNNIYNCSNTLIGNYKYFAEFTEWLNGEGKHYIMNFFKNEVDLTDFNPRQTVQTDIKIDVKIKSLDDFSSFMMAVLNGDVTDHSLDDWNDVETSIGRDDLYNSFLNYHPHSRMDKREFSQKLSNLLQFSVKSEKWKDNWKKKVDGKSFAYYKLPVKLEAQELFAKTLNETVDTLFNRVLKTKETGKLSYSDLVKKDVKELENQEVVVNNYIESKFKNESSKGIFSAARNRVPAKTINSISVKR